MLITEDMQQMPFLANQAISDADMLILQTAKNESGFDDWTNCSNRHK